MPQKKYMGNNLQFFMNIPYLQIYKVLWEYNLEKDEITRISMLPSGINQVYLIEVSGKKRVLKNYIKLKSPKLDDIHSSIIFLMKEGLKIPKISQNTQGKYLTKINDVNYDLSQYIKHVDLSDQIHISNNHLKLAAIELAKIHKLANKQKIVTRLEKIDFADKTSFTIKKIEEFMLSFESIHKAADEESRKKLLILKKIIEQTQKFRKNGREQFFQFLDQPFVPTHGDYSMVNILITPRDGIKVIDWDNLALRPLVWDLQAALSLFSSKYQGNAYFVEPDYEKLFIFLSAYLKENPLPKKDLLLLPEVAKYNFSIYWLSYTIPALLRHDFRLLYLIPAGVEKALYWIKNMNSYKDLLENFVRKYT